MNTKLQILLAILIFISGICWEKFDNYLGEKRQNDKLMILIKMELSDNWAIVNQNRQTIEANLKSLKEKKTTIRPLLLFQHGAWDAAKYKGATFIKETADLFKIVHCYIGLNTANEKIRYRENYRLTNEGSNVFLERMKLTDEDVLSCINKAQISIEEAQKVLYRIHQFKVKGRSFITDEHGKVEEIEVDNKEGVFNMNSLLKALFAVLEIAGIYILSKHLFDRSFKKQLNFTFKELPWFLKLALITFGDKGKFQNRELWVADDFPSKEHFPLRKKLEITLPFIGFTLICLGVIGRLLL